MDTPIHNAGHAASRTSRDQSLHQLCLVAALATCLPLLPVVADPCPGRWLPPTGLPGPSGFVSTMIRWDHDGPGPAPEVLVAGGLFNIPTEPLIQNLAMWNPTTGQWSAIGTDPIGWIDAAVVMPNGDLVVGGPFTSVGTLSSHHLARWNGMAWSDLGGGTDGDVYALLVLPNGDLIAGGDFAAAGSTAAGSVARWNGTEWTALGPGLTTTNGRGFARTLVKLPNGDVVAGGSFTKAGGVSASNLARWNGASWSSLGGGVAGSRGIYSMTNAPNGDLIVAGWFTDVGSSSLHQTANGVARWNGSAWSAFSSGIPGGAPLYAIAILPNGDLIVGGLFSTAGGQDTPYIARWNGSNWFPVGSPLNSTVDSVCVLANGDLAVGGSFGNGGPISRGFIRWSTRRIYPADFNCSDSVSIQDFFDYLTPWFARLPIADFNADGTVDVQDLYGFLSAWLSK